MELYRLFENFPSKVVEIVNQKEQVFQRVKVPA